LDGTVTAQLSGEPVTVSTPDMPALGRGEFVLANDGDETVAARVSEAWLELGDERRTLTGLSLFDLDAGQAIEGDSFEVGAGASLRFALGFPRVTFSGPSLSGVAVGLHVEADGGELEARSPVLLERRMPRLSDDNIA
jgi:hypothetical protein